MCMVLVSERLKCSVGWIFLYLDGKLSCWSGVDTGHTVTIFAPVLLASIQSL